MYIWPITPAAGVPWLTRALSCGARPSKQLSFGARGVVLELVFVFVKPNQIKFICMKPNSNLNHFQQLLLHTVPLPLDQYNLFRFYQKNRLQNWVTSTGGRHNLVPGLTSPRNAGHRRDRPYAHNVLSILFKNLLESYFFVFLQKNGLKKKCIIERR